MWVQAAMVRFPKVRYDRDAWSSGHGRWMVVGGPRSWFERRVGWWCPKNVQSKWMRWAGRVGGVREGGLGGTEKVERWKSSERRGAGCV